MKRDISHREDIDLVIREFYGLLQKDDLIGHFFSDVIQLSFEEHIPVIVDFWTAILLNQGRYKGQLIAKHIALDEKSQLEKHHMERWQELFYATIDQHFEGAIVDEAKRRVGLMGELMLFKVHKAREGNSIF